MNISNFYNVKDYLYILNGALISDLIVLILFYYSPLMTKTKTLFRWYNTFGLSAIIADVLSLVLGIVITRFIFTHFKLKYNIFKFIAILVMVQLTHDLLFYALFKNIKRNKNKMLDLFKDYALEYKYHILYADAIMLIIAFLSATYLSKISLNTNLVILICLLYILPYILHTK